jgi:hypothetical protein
MAQAESGEQRVIVLRYDPRRRNFVLLIVSAVLLSVALAAFFAGRHVATHERTLALQKQAELEAKLRSSSSELQELRQQVANLKLGTEVDRVAANQVRQEVKVLRDGIAKLEEDIAFYRSLMDPGAEKAGLDIRSLELYRRAIDDPIRYKIVMQQLGARHPVIKGSINLDVIGLHKGEKAVIPLGDLSNEQVEKTIKLRFRYFQNIEGELVLPKDFEPMQIRVMARSLGNNGRQIEKLFDWIVKEV